MRKGSGNGKGIQFLRESLNYPGDECLIWPFSTTNGYGCFGYHGKLHYAHRFMCELVHGPCPSDDHIAGHDCGNGDKGCVHPKHVKWKTYGENQLDRTAHGTRNVDGPRGKLTPAKAAEIRMQRGKVRQKDLAAKYGVTRSVICNIQCGRAWPEVKTRQWRGKTG